MDSRDTRYAGSRYLVFIINENKRDTLYASSDNWDTARECARGLADEIGDLEECVAQGRTDIPNDRLDAWDACTYEEGDLEEYDRDLADELRDLEECIAQWKADNPNDRDDSCECAGDLADDVRDLEECNAQGKSYIPKESVYILDTKKLCIWIIQSVQRAKWAASQPHYDRSFDASEGFMDIGEDLENLPGYVPSRIEELYAEDSNYIHVYSDTRGYT